MNDIDLDAGITFCGSWGADDCAFIREGQPLDWACGFHSILAELRELRSRGAYPPGMVARVTRGEPVVILGKRYIHVPSQPQATP